MKSINLNDWKGLKQVNTLNLAAQKVLKGGTGEGEEKKDKDDNGTFGGGTFGGGGAGGDW